jgi:PPOX class probable F420-dependent enzyme
MSASPFEPRERRYVEAARVGRLATADAEGRPHAVPVCFALADGAVVSAIDEKPQSVGPGALRRSRDVRENPRVALVVDHYVEDWSALGWVQVRGTATHLSPDDAETHASACDALREKYDQYADHALEERPILRIAPGSVRSWGRLDPPDARG